MPLKRSQILDIVTGLIVATVVAVAWTRSFRGAGLWIDEAITYWVIKDGPAAAFHRALHYQGQSPAYFLLLSLWNRLIGDSEELLRLPSLLGLLGAGWFLWRIAAKEFGVVGAAAAVSAFAVSPLVAESTGARPYAFALLGAAGSYWYLRRALTPPYRYTDGVKYLLFILTAFLSSYLFAGILIIQIFLYLQLRKSVPPGMRNFLGLVLLLLLLLSLFAKMQLHLLEGENVPLFFANIPKLGDLMHVLFPTAVFVPLGAAVLLGAIFGAFWPGAAGDSAPRSVDRGTVFNLVLWWLLPGTITYLFSVFSGSSLFIPRYFGWAAPASALIFGFALSRAPRKSFAVAGLSLAAVLMLFDIWPRHVQFGDWRGAVAIVNGHPGTAPVLLYPGLVELRNTALLTQPERAEYFSSPLIRYPTNRDHVVIPGEFRRPDPLAYYHDVVEPRIVSEQEFFLIAANFEVPESSDSQGAALELYAQVRKLGFEGQPLRTNDPVWVVRFTRTPVKNANS